MHWDKRWKDLGKQEHNTFAYKIFNEYIKEMNTNISILDIGAGNGADTTYFYNLGFKNITAVDLSKSAIDSLKEKLPIKTLHENIRDIMFKEKTFDIIYAHLSLHYFNDIETKAIFDKIISWLKPNGYFFVKCKSVHDNLKNEKCVDKNMYQPEGGWARHLFSKKYMNECFNLSKNSGSILFTDETSHKYHDFFSHYIESGYQKK